MHAYISALFSWFADRFRGRMELKLEVIALRHQLAVLRRQRPGRPRLFCIDRLLWVWLYRVWPRCLNVIVLVKPATVVQWHRQGFRLYWRWRSRSGRPSVNPEIRDVIRQMNRANPLWGAPRIHGELLKLGIEASQATVAKYIARQAGTPSPNWRSFLSNQASGIAAIDMFVTVSVSFRLLYVTIILAHDRRKIVRFDVTQHPTAAWLSQQVIEAFPWDTAPHYLLRDRDAAYGAQFSKRVASMGITELARRDDSLTSDDLRGWRRSPGPHARANPAHTRGFRLIIRDVRESRDWMVDDAVCCEPISAKIATCETGNFFI